MSKEKLSVDHAKGLTEEEKQKTFRVVRELEEENKFYTQKVGLLYMAQVVYPSMKQYAEQKTSSLIEENKSLQTELDQLRVKCKGLRKAINLIYNHFPPNVLEDQMGEHYDDFKNLTK